MLVGFVAAGVILVVLLWLVDIGQVSAALLNATPGFLVLLFGFAILWLAAWAGTLRTVLGAMDIDIPRRTAFSVYTAAVFANNVTPFGQAGGEPITALLVSKVSGQRYETGLVSIASVDVLNAVSSFAVVFLGIGLYASRSTVESNVYAAVLSIVVLVVGIIAAFTLGWRYHEELIERLAGPMAAFLDRLRVGPFSTMEPVTEATVTDRMERFLGNVETIGEDRRALLTAVSFSTLGWLLQTAALVMAFSALGTTVPVAVAMFVIPLANLAGMAPLPGGLGGIEAAFVALLVPTTGAEAAVATAAVLLFRVGIYWLPVVIGGAIATTYGATELS